MSLFQGCCRIKKPLRYFAATVPETRHLGAAKRARTIRAQQKGHRTKRAKGKRSQSKKGAEQKGREITMLRHRYIQGRNFFR